MHEKPNGCTKPMPSTEGKVQNKQSGGQVTNPTYTTPTEKMPSRMR